MAVSHQGTGRGARAHGSALELPQNQGPLRRSRGNTFECGTFGSALGRGLGDRRDVERMQAGGHVDVPSSSVALASQSQ